MKKDSMKIRTIAITLSIFSLVVCNLVLIRKNEIQHYEEFRARQALWKERNIEVENKIKNYINNIDWTSYIQELKDALSNPFETLDEYVDDFPVEDLTDN